MALVEKAGRHARGLRARASKVKSFVTPQGTHALLQEIERLEREFPKKRFVWEVREYLKSRSLAQNARYWGHVFPYIAEQVTVEGRKFSAECWHERFKREFIGREELPSGEVVGKSSQKLKVTEFADFMTKVEAWAVDHNVRFYESLREHNEDAAA